MLLFYSYYILGVPCLGFPIRSLYYSFTPRLHPSAFADAQAWELKLHPRNPLGSRDPNTEIIPLWALKSANLTYIGLFECGSLGSAALLKPQAFRSSCLNCYLSVALPRIHNIALEADQSCSRLQSLHPNNLNHIP